MDPELPNQSCKEIFAQLSDYLNLELPPDACAMIEKHVAGCGPCIDFVQSLRKTVDLCRQYRPHELPRELGSHAREQLLDAYRKALAAK